MHKSETATPKFATFTPPPSTLSTNNTNISTPRRPLGPINSNRVQKKKLSPYKRGQIVRAAKIDGSLTAISKVTKTLKSTIKTTLRRASIRTNRESLPCSSRPKQYINRDIYRLIRLI